MAGLVPAIHALLAALSEKEDVKARHRAGHDEQGAKPIDTSRLRDELA
jgi:hypothetical protein